MNRREKVHEVSQDNMCCELAIPTQQNITNGVWSFVQVFGQCSQRPDLTYLFIYLMWSFEDAGAGLDDPLGPFHLRYSMIL